MSEIVSRAAIQIDVDASGAEVGLRKVNDAVTQTGRTVDNIGKGDGFKRMASGADSAADQVEKATKRHEASIKRVTAEMAAGAKGSVEYARAMAAFGGADMARLKPLLDQLDAVTKKTALAAEAQRKLDASSSFLDGLRSKTDAIGKTASEMASLRAAQLGVSDSAAPMIARMREAEKATAGFGAAAGSTRALLGSLATVVSATVLTGWVKGAIDAADGLKDLSASTSISIRDLSGLRLASQQAGAELEGTAAAINKLSVNIGKDAEKYAKLGITAKEPLEAFKQLADIFSAIDDPQQRAALGAEALGKSWSSAAPLLSEGGKRIGEMVQRGRELSGITPELAASADEFNDALAEVSTTVGAVSSRIAVGLLPVLRVLATDMTASSNASTSLSSTFATGLTEAFRAVVVLGGNVSFVLKTVGTEIGGIAAQIAALATLDFKGFKFIGDTMKKDAQEGRRAFDEWEKAILTAGTKVQDATKKAASVDVATDGAAAAAKKLAAARAAAFVDSAGADSASKKAASAIEKEADAYATLTASINERIAAVSREAAGLAPLTESQKLQSALDAQAESGKVKLTASHKAAYEARIKELSVEEQLLVQRKQIDASNVASAKVRADYAAQLGKSVADANKEADANEALARTYGLSKSAIEALTIARLEEQAERVRAIDGAHDEADALDLVIAAKKRSAAALSSVDTQEATKKANKAMTDEWEKTVDKYEDVFRTGFADMLNKGKDGWKSFTTSLVTTFKTSVADQIYKMFAQPFVIKLVGSLLGVTGGAGLAGAAQAATGAAGGPGLISTASNAYSLVTGGMALAGGLGTGFAGSVAGGLMGAGAGAGFTSAAGLAIGEGIAGVVGPSVAASISSGMGAVAAAMPWLAAAAIGGVLLNKAFGRGPKEITGTTINGMFGDQGFTGTTDAAFVKKGGWFRSDKTGVDKTDVDAATAKQFGAGYDALKAASADFAKVLGINADSIKDRAQSLSIAITKDEEANKKAIADFFTGVGNTIAKELLPTISDFAKEGEGASATLQRLATNYATIDAALSGISLTFGTIGVESLAARERLVTLSGGIEALVQNAAGFAQNYLTEAERLAPVASMVAKSMADLGFASIDTRDEFKALVQSLDLTTESGATNYAALMKLQGAFAEVAKASEVAADAAIASAKATADAAIEARDRAIEAAKATASSLLGNADDSLGVLQRVANAEKDRLTKAHEVAMKRLQIGIDTETAAIAKTRALSDSIKSTISQISGGPDRATAQAQIQTAIAMAKAGGVLPSADSLKDALSVLSRDSGQFATLQEFQRDQYQTQNSLAELGKLTDSALSVEEKTLAALEAQKEAAQAAYEGEIGRLDEVVSAAQSQIDILKGIDTTGLTIVQALEALRTAILSAQGNSVAGSTSAITDAYNSALGRMPDSGGLAYFQDRAAAGASVSDIVSGIKNSPEAQVQAAYKELLGRNADAGGLDYFLKSGGSIEAIRAALMNSDEYRKNLPRLAVGTNEVPYDMDARIHRGERVMPAADNRALMALLRNPPDNNGALAASLDRVSAAIERLTVVSTSGSTSSAKVAELLENISGGGGPLLVEIA